ncbi:hypothetical protein O1L52_16795, partial [Pseudomonas aeruginosa]
PPRSTLLASSAASDVYKRQQLRVPLPDGQVLELEAPVDEMWQRSLERLND